MEKLTLLYLEIKKIFCSIKQKLSSESILVINIMKKHLRKFKKSVKIVKIPSIKHKG